MKGGKRFLEEDRSFTVTEISMIYFLEKEGFELINSVWRKGGIGIQVFPDLNYFSVSDGEVPIASINLSDLRTAGYRLYWNQKMDIYPGGVRREEMISKLQEILHLYDGKIFSVKELKKFTVPALQEIYKEVFEHDVDSRNKKEILARIEKHLERIAKPQKEVLTGEEEAYIWCPARGHRIHELVCRRWRNPTTCSATCERAPEGTSKIEIKRERRRRRKMEKTIEKNITESAAAAAPKKEKKPPKAKKKSNGEGKGRKRKDGKSRREVVLGIFKKHKGKVTPEQLATEGGWKNPAMVIFSVTRKGADPLKVEHDKKKGVYILK
jgi:hypothetical protein